MKRSKSFIKNKDNQQDFQESSKQLCTSLENKLCQLNQMGLNLKKENQGTNLISKSSRNVSQINKLIYLFNL